ncbi:MAG: sugar phosphate isomerase/epimerase [Nitrospinota bacterium]|nr:MAG: sugar phosphate isomerase/epimerase [Nitrospinota bacterium]
MMHLGSSTFWWREEALVPRHFEQLAAAGVTAVEISDYHPNFDYFRVQRLRETGRVARENGLTIATVHTHLRWYDPALHLAHPEPKRYRRAVEAYLRAVDALAILGSSLLLTHDLDLSGEGGGEDPAARERTVSALREIADYAHAAGMRVVVENMPRGWAADVSRLYSVVKAVDHPALGVCIDTAHAYRGDEVEQALRLTAPHLMALHINDADARVEHLCPGDGQISWATVMQTLHDIGYTGDFVYELDDARHLATLQANFTWLHGLMSGKEV